MDSITSIVSPSWNTPSSLVTPASHCSTPSSCDETEVLRDIDRAEQSTAVMKASSQTDQPFEALVYQVLSLLIKEEEKATLIYRDAIYAERLWQRNLSDLLEKEHSVCHTYESRNEVAHKASDMIFPLSLVAEGMVSMFGAGGFGLLSIGAVAFGALLCLDTLFDNTVKDKIASFLARGDGEETKNWFQRITTYTSVAIFGASFFFSGAGAVTLASNASKLVVTCAETATEKMLNDQKARLIDNEKKWEDSGRCMRELLGDVDRQVKYVNSMFSLLADLQKSTTQATAQIF